MSKPFSVIGAVIMGALLSTVAQTASADAAAGAELYKRESCETCHGGNLQGSLAFPNLLTSPKTANKDEFSKIVLEGKNTMPAFKGNKNVESGINELFDYINSKKPK